MINDQDEQKIFDEAVKTESPDFEKNLNIAVVGKVSAGKSSLINAILGKTRKNAVAKVGSTSGVTQDLAFYQLDEHTLIVDCPGLNDIKKANSEVTKKFLEYIDIGLFVVTDSSDVSQRQDYEALRKECGKTIVVLNKIDMFPGEIAYQKAVEQWKIALGVNKIIGTSARAFDPDGEPKKDIIEGIEELQKEILDFLEKDGKNLLLQRHLKDKHKYAVGIISSAVAATALEAFIPGSAAYITATQVVAITSLHYLYRGEVLSKATALSLVGSFSAETIGMTAFVWLKSFLPPTGIVDIAAAGVAMVITFAMLASVKWVLENDYSLEDKSKLKEMFAYFKNVGGELKNSLKNISLDDIKNNKDLFFDMILNLLRR